MVLISSTEKNFLPSYVQVEKKIHTVVQIDSIHLMPNMQRQSHIHIIIYKNVYDDEKSVSSNTDLQSLHLYILSRA